MTQGEFEPVREYRCWVGEKVQGSGWIIRASSHERAVTRLAEDMGISDETVIAHDGDVVRCFRVRQHVSRELIASSVPNRWMREHGFKEEKMIWQPKEDQEKAWEALFAYLREIRDSELRTAHYSAGREMLGTDGTATPVPGKFMVANIVFVDDAGGGP